MSSHRRLSLGRETGTRSLIMINQFSQSAEFRLLPRFLVFEI